MLRIIGYPSFRARKGVFRRYCTDFSVGAVNQGAKPGSPTRTGSMLLLGVMADFGGFHERRRLVGRGAFSFGGFRLFFRMGLRPHLECCCTLT